MTLIGYLMIKIVNSEPIRPSISRKNIDNHFWILINLFKSITNRTTLSISWKMLTNVKRLEKRKPAKTGSKKQVDKEELSYRAVFWSMRAALQDTGASPGYKISCKFVFLYLPMHRSIDFSIGNSTKSTSTKGINVFRLIMPASDTELNNE